MKADEVAQGLWQEALEQAQDGSGWLYGPYSERELDDLFPEGWVPSRRFGVQQGDRTRAIDDLRASLVNATCTATDKIVLQDIDVVAQTARKFLEAVASRKQAGQRQLVGRALDLKSAYKQLASAPCDGWASILAVWQPDEQQYRYFRFATLPFGAVHSVTAFNRVAKALRTILLKIVRLVVTSFYDDFCQLELQELADSAQGTAQLVLQLLGWRIAEDPKKCLPFAKVFSMLGASFSFTQGPSGNPGDLQQGRQAAGFAVASELGVRRWLRSACRSGQLEGQISVRFDPRIWPRSCDGCQVFDATLGGRGHPEG